MLTKTLWLKELHGAWIFYTILPPWPSPKPRFERIARFAPLIGIFIGLIQSALWVVLSYLNWPKESLAIFAVSMGIVITGGLHLDGLMDTFDGLAAKKERLIEAMKDSRVGAIGVLAAIIAILIQIGSLIKLNYYAAISIPIAAFWGRCAQFWAIDKFAYINKVSNSKSHKKYWKGMGEELLPSAIILLLITAASVKFQAIGALLVVNMLGARIAIAIPNIIGSKIGGHNGDSYGASLVITETLTLIILALSLPSI